MKNIIITLTALISYSITAQQTPASAQTESILILGATAHIGDGTVIENSALGFDQGKITYIGKNDGSQTDYDRVIDARGQHLYPGFIATNSTLGLVEIDAVRATYDEDEIGAMLPHIRSAIAYDAESKIVESMRPNGVLAGQVVPRGGSISGSSSVMQFDAWNWEDALIKADEGLHLNWPSPYSRGRWWRGEDPGLKANKNYSESVNELKDFFDQAKAYLQDPGKPKHLPYHAMQAVFDNQKTVYLHASDQIEIKDGIRFLKSYGLSKIVLVGGHESTAVVDFLKENNIAVILSRPHRLPESEDEDPKGTFRTAATLIEAGLVVSVDVSGRMERMYTRNLPFYAGSFAAYGVPREKAVEMITGAAAKILGVDDQMGTLAVGKDATLFVSVGDALDMRTNIVEHAFIQGRNLSLETHHTKLWKRYSEKYSQQ